MKPEPMPFIGTERVKSLNESPKKCLNIGSSSNGKGVLERLAIFSTSILTTAREARFTIGTIGLLMLPANEPAAETRINASVRVNAINIFFVIINYLRINFFFRHVF